MRIYHQLRFVRIHILTGNILCLDSWSELSGMLRGSQGRRRPCVCGRPAGHLDDTRGDSGADQDIRRAPDTPGGERRPHRPQHQGMFPRQNRAGT